MEKRASQNHAATKGSRRKDVQSAQKERVADCRKNASRNLGHRGPWRLEFGAPQRSKRGETKTTTDNDKRTQIYEQMTIGSSTQPAPPNCTRPPTLLSWLLRLGL